MKILIVGDVHFDFWKKAGRDPFAALTPKDISGLQAVFIAGDLTNKPRVRWKYAIRHLSRYFEPGRIHITPGNHDYYDFHIDDDDRLADIAQSEGACIAQKAEIFVVGTRFLCCTLWTDFALHGDIIGAQETAAARMNDYRYIRKASDGYRKIRPSDIALLHEEHLSWLEGRLSQKHSGRTIVITHHSPHPQLITDAPSQLDPIFGSDLREVIARHQPAAWFFGHTHHRAETFAGRTLIRNVSLGYPWQVDPGSERALILQNLLDLDEQSTDGRCL